MVIKFPLFLATRIDFICRVHQHDIFNSFRYRNDSQDNW